jgi:hypothetical protein
MYGGAMGRSFHEGIGSRYDEISGLDRAVPKRNARANAAFFLIRWAIETFWRRNFFVIFEVV